MNRLPGRFKMRCGVLAVVAVATGGLLTHSASADPAPLTEESAANDVADQIQHAGEVSYPSEFVAVEPIDASDIKIYTTGSASALMSYANGIANSSGVTVIQISQSRSLSDIEAVTQTIANNHTVLVQDNINLQSVGQDVENNTVEVILAPSPYPHPTPNAYVTHAQADIDALVGPGKAVVSNTIGTGNASFFDSRGDDSAPFNGGLSIDAHTQNHDWVCSDSWLVQYQPTGALGQLTAGHCGPGTAYELTHLNREIGGLINRHFENGELTDFEVAKNSGNVAIWKSGTSTYLPTQASNPAYHSLVTTNGGGTGERTSLKVLKIHTCYFVGSDEICGVDILDNQNAVCAGGDSGGPVYHRIDSTHVRESGIIEGGTGTIGQPGSRCYFLTIEQILELGSLAAILGF